MLWVKALHIIFMVAWMAGLLYLPRLFVYHVECEDLSGRKRFQIMERRLYLGIMWPALLVTVSSGLWLLWDYAWGAYSQSIWLHIKLGCVTALVVYHLFCANWIKKLKAGKHQLSSKFFRWMNEIPFLIMALIVILVIVKPFGVRCGVHIVDTIYSPDSVHVATVFQSTCGRATTNVSVFKVADGLSSEEGNVFIASGSLQLKADWPIEDRLVVHYPNDAAVLKLVTQIDRLNIQFNAQPHSR